MQELFVQTDKKLIPTLPRYTFEGRIVVVQSEQEAERAVQYLSRKTELGIDTENPEIKKIGLSLKDDVQQLSKRRPSLKPKNFVDLQQMAAQMGIRDMSLAKLFANFFRLRISKNAQLSNWEADALDEKQRIYAATDADACLKLYRRMQELQQTGNFQLVAPEIPTIKSTDQ